jgi:hypothetical protein
MPYVRSNDGCRIHYEVTGRKSAPPVLMIQGLGMDKHGWTLQRLAFSWKYRVIAFDNRGSGRSDKPLGDYDLYQMAQDAVAVLDDLGIERAAFDRDIAQIRRLTPGPVRRTIRRVPALITGVGRAIDRSGIAPRVRTWITREDPTT